MKDNQLSFHKVWLISSFASTQITLEQIYKQFLFSCVSTDVVFLSTIGSTHTAQINYKAHALQILATPRNHVKSNPLKGRVWPVDATVDTPLLMHGIDSQAKNPKYFLWWSKWNTFSSIVEWLQLKRL